ncbi:hypothetical protein PVAP13_9NG165100 [Panicum virgatum]|uniref:Uncharacterized protein n=1 Tax=Panicum virgatum TaxID=38727 RepID=A0A8T0MN42_PANVG|nr:hypothetical protein PVAP13_9NG165100 [Panicum virgatum]
MPAAGLAMPRRTLRWPRTPPLDAPEPRAPRQRALQGGSKGSGLRLHAPELRLGRSEASRASAPSTGAPPATLPFWHGSAPPPSPAGLARRHCASRASAARRRPLQRGSVLPQRVPSAARQLGSCCF